MDEKKLKVQGLEEHFGNELLVFNQVNISQLTFPHPPPLLNHHKPTDSTQL